MRILFYILLPVATFIFFSLPSEVYAQSQSDPRPPKILQSEISKGGQVFYMGNYEGMNSWVLIRKGKAEYFYENKDRTALVMGLLFNEDGELLTTAQLSMLKDRVGEDALYSLTGRPEIPAMNTDNAHSNTSSPKAVENDTVSASTTSQAIPAQQTEAPTQKGTESKPLNRPLTRADYMYVDLVQANWIVMNPEAKHEILVFIDPDCPHCKNMIRSAMAFDGPEGIKMHMILVGLREDSIRRAAMLMAMTDPAEALIAHANGDENALNPPETINTKAIESNLAVMAKYGFDVTPLTVYKTRQNQIRLIRGTPDDFNLIINDIINN